MTRHHFAPQAAFSRHFGVTVEYSGCLDVSCSRQGPSNKHIANLTRALEANVVALVLTAYGHKNKKTPCLFRLDLFREPDTPHQVFEPGVRPQSIHHGIELQPTW
jgi:hypothetical protein